MLEYAARVASPRALLDGLILVFQRPDKPRNLKTFKGILRENIDKNPNKRKKKMGSAIRTARFSDSGSPQSRLKTLTWRLKPHFTG